MRCEEHLGYSWATCSIIRWGTLSDSCMGFLMEFTKWWVGSVTLCSVLFWALAVHSSSPSLLLSHAVHNSVFWIRWERNGPLYNCGSWVLHTFPLSPMGKITGWDLSWYWAVPSWRRNDMGKMKQFLLPFPVDPIPYFYVLQQYVGTSLLNFQTSTKALLSMGDCQNWHSLRRKWEKTPISLFWGHHSPDKVSLLF